MYEGLYLFISKNGCLVLGDVCFSKPYGRVLYSDEKLVSTHIGLDIQSMFYFSIQGNVSYK